MRLKRLLRGAGCPVKLLEMIQHTHSGFWAVMFTAVSTADVSAVAEYVSEGTTIIVR